MAKKVSGNSLIQLTVIDLAVEDKQVVPTMQNKLLA
jgi:hypothetical protein